MDYNHNKIEAKWQKKWEENQSFKIENFSKKPKMYILDMFPYPSGEGLHMGHVESYAATDIFSRFKRMQGYNVLAPMGFDAFGLPAEQYALTTNNDPDEFTRKNTKNYERQLKALGKGVDWDRKFLTCDPEYYKWTQWIFKKLYEKGLATLEDTEVNFCPELGSVLANDEIEVKNGVMVSERGGFPVYKKTQKQWVLNITAYAERLLNDLDLIDWPIEIKESQRNWIGKSSGANVKFKVVGHDEEIEIFTTRVDTIYGVSYLVLAPEHPLVLKITTQDEMNQVKNYLKLASQKSDLERETSKIKTGIFTGAFAINPINGEKVPVWVSDYVLYKYATGAVMAVPAHDERDFEFAKAYGLDVVKIIDVKDEELPFTGDGLHINSELINGLNNEDSSKKLIKHITEKGFGEEKISYRLRNWIFSRQRYWGEPFPVLFDEEGKIHMVADKDLPVTLPKMKNIKPNPEGKSPLANEESFVNVEIKGKKYTRETNTMPQVAGSSWYYIAYLLTSQKGILPLNSKEAKKIIDEWLPVDLYIGGKEHTVGHLLYARFWHKFLYDLGLVSTPEPFQKLYNQGVILKDGTKMSKSRGNVVNPDDIFEEFGADSARLYIMFMGPLNMDKEWTTTMLEGSKRFIDRVVRMFDMVTDEETPELQVVLHQTIKKITEDYETLAFNTAISQMMIFVNEVYKLGKINKDMAKTYLQLMNPITPHITEELNEVVLGNKEELLNQPWPKYDESHLRQDEVEIVFQVNGKVRSKKMFEIDTPEADVKRECLQDENIRKYIKGLNVVKMIYVKNKLVNVVAK